MTKQRKPLNWTEFELCWGTRSSSGELIPEPSGKTVHVTRETAADTLDMALIEQAFAIKGPDTVARLLAWRLRQPSPSRTILDQIARMLDPSDDGYLKLKVVRHRRGKTATRNVNDAAIAKAVKKGVEVRRNRHGKQKIAVREVAKQFGYSRAKVLKAIRSK
jgi:hypothetical protein